MREADVGKKRGEGSLKEKEEKKWFHTTFANSEELKKERVVVHESQVTRIKLKNS